MNMTNRAKLQKGDTFTQGNAGHESHVYETIGVGNNYVFARRLRDGFETLCDINCDYEVIPRESIHATRERIKGILNDTEHFNTVEELIQLMGNCVQNALADNAKDDYSLSTDEKIKVGDDLFATIMMRVNGAPIPRSLRSHLTDDQWKRAIFSIISRIEQAHSGWQIDQMRDDIPF